MNNLAVPGRRLVRDQNAGCQRPNLFENCIDSVEVE